MSVNNPRKAEMMENDPDLAKGASDVPAAFPCRDMVDVRREIDRVDRLIVALIAERQNYIEQAGRIKSSRDTVRDMARVEDVVAKVTTEAKRNGALPELVETVYRTMMEYCINYEFNVFDAKAALSKAK
jgi:isochorismate pyruvate lyase